jgi:AraC-like DNA-binding protein
MKFEFSTTLEKANCHIRSYGNGPIQPEIIDQRPHKHFFLEFHCVFAGEEVISLPEERREIHLLPGQILMLPREIYHGAYTKKGTVERLCFNFSVEPSEKGTRSVMERFLKIKDVRLFEDAVANSLANQCRLLRAQANTPLADVRQGMLMLNMVLHLCSNLTGPRQPAAPESSHALRQKWFIEEYIESHFTDDCSLEGLAQALFLSQRQTRTLIRRFFGEDYKSIIIRRRMELAAFYLQDEEKTLEEIAALVGYSSYSGFQLCFKRYFGMSPSEKRKKA